MANKKKRNIAMFLGAGASKAFNYPVTREILNLIIEDIISGILFTDDDVNDRQAALYRILVKELIISLSPGLRPAFENGKTDEQNKLPLITELLSQAEHLNNNEHTLADFNFDIKNPLLGGIDTLNERWNLKDVITLLEWAIIKAINKEGNKTKTKLDRFISWVRQTNVSENAYISIITSNYDYAVEWNLLEYGEGYDAHKLIDYGFNWRDVGDGKVYLRPANPLFRIFKLHGSTDWLKCHRCGFIYINPTEDIYDIAFSNTKRPANTCHCNYWPLSPVLVTPSYSRTVKDTNLSQVWRNTLELLRTADEWVITGYSLPGEDLDIKSLFIRALKGRVKAPLIKVIQQTNNSQEQYDHFFGKENYTFIEGGFEHYDLSAVQTG